MSQITISNLDDRTMQGLKQIAWQKGLSFHESLRCLLRDSATAGSPIARRDEIEILREPAETA